MSDSHSMVVKYTIWLFLENMKSLVLKKHTHTHTQKKLWVLVKAQNHYLGVHQNTKNIYVYIYYRKKDFLNF